MNDFTCFLLSVSAAELVKIKRAIRVLTAAGVSYDSAVSVILTHAIARRNDRREHNTRMAQAQRMAR